MQRFNGGQRKRVNKYPSAFSHLFCSFGNFGDSCLILGWNICKANYLCCHVDSWPLWTLFDGRDRDLEGTDYQLHGNQFIQCRNLEGGGGDLIAMAVVKDDRQVTVIQLTATWFAHFWFFGLFHFVTNYISYSLLFLTHCSQLVFLSPSSLNWVESTP